MKVFRARHTEIGWQAGDVWLRARLAHAPDVTGLVLIAEHGSGNLRDSRNAYLAAALNSTHLATLQIALLSRHEEERAPDTWRNVSLLAGRMHAALEWVRHQPALADLPVGMAAHDEAAGAMIRVAVRPDTRLQALASRGGRPDLAGAAPLRDLAVPVLLVAGEDDPSGIELANQARRFLGAENDLVTVRDASHDFSEPGTLDELARILREWFVRRLATA